MDYSPDRELFVHHQKQEKMLTRNEKKQEEARKKILVRNEIKQKEARKKNIFNCLECDFYSVGLCQTF